MTDKQETKTKNPLGLKRIFSAFGYSIDGLKHAAGKEPAFQQELMFLVAMTVGAFLLPFPIEIIIAITISHLFILIVELLNSAIEAVVDKASPEYHDLAKQSKDMGSAAVLLAIVIAVIIWGYAIYEVTV